MLFAPLWSEQLFCAMTLRPSGGDIDLVVGDSSSSDPTGVRALMPCSASNGVIPVSESVVVFHTCASIGMYR